MRKKEVVGTILGILVMACSSPTMSEHKAIDQGRNIGFPTGPSDPSVYEAENYTGSSGIINAGSYVGGFDNGDYISFANFDFGAITAPQKLEYYYAVPGGYDNQVVEIRLDSSNGPIVAYSRPQATGGWAIFKKMQVGLNAFGNVTGIHTLVVRANGGTGIFNLESFRVMTLPVAPFDTVNQVESYYTEFKDLKLINNFQSTGFADDGTRITFENVDFGDESADKVLQLRLSNGSGSGKYIKVYLDGYVTPPGQTLPVPVTNSYETFQTVDYQLGTVSGKKTLRLEFHGGTGVANIDWFKVIKKL